VELAAGHTLVGISVLSGLAVFASLILLIYRIIGRAFTRPRSATGALSPELSPAVASRQISMLRVAELITRGGAISLLTGAVFGLVSLTVPDHRTIVSVFALFLVVIGLANLGMGLAWKRHAVRQKPSH
jgi:hypothetical protein